MRKIVEAYVSPPCEMRRAVSMTSWKSFGSPVSLLFSSVIVTFGTGFLRPPVFVQVLVRLDTFEVRKDKLDCMF